MEVLTRRRSQRSRRSGRARRRRPIVSSALLVVISALLAIAEPAAAVPGNDLANERFTALVGWSEDVVATEAVEACAEPGAARVPFRMEGRASGPYPGSFEESGIVTVGPRTGTKESAIGVEIGEGPVRAFMATFSITSGETTIEGVKWLDPSAGVSLAGCDAFVDAPSSTNLGWRFTGFEISRERVPVRYRATIVTPGGSMRVRGTGWVTLFAEHEITTFCPLPPPVQCSSGGSGLGFAERFF